MGGRATRTLVPGIPAAAGRTPTDLPAALKTGGSTDLVADGLGGVTVAAGGFTSARATGRDSACVLVTPGATDTLAEAVPLSAPPAPPLRAISTPCCPALSSFNPEKTTDLVCLGSIVPRDRVSTCLPFILTATPTPGMLEAYGFDTVNVSEHGCPAVGTDPLDESINWLT